MKKIIYLLVATLAIASCDKNIDRSIITLDNPTDAFLVMESSGGSKEIKFYSVTSWTASVDEKDTNWCSISATSGEGSNFSQFTINAEANTSKSDIITNITIVSEGGGVQAIQLRVKQERK